MAHYCDQCNNLLDISRKVIKKEKQLDTSTEKETEDTTKYDDLIKKLENNEQLSPEELVNVNVKDLLKSEYYKQVQGKGKIRKLLMDMIDEAANSDENTQAYFVCKNCAYSKPIKSGTLIYTKNIETLETEESNDDYTVYRNMKYQKIMPRTRNFACSNPTCISNTDKNTPSEACFFRKHNSYELVMVCAYCSSIEI